MSALGVLPITSVVWPTPRLLWSRSPA